MRHMACSSKMAPQFRTRYWTFFLVALLALTGGCSSRRKVVETPAAPAKRLEISYDRLRAYDVDHMRRLAQQRMNAGNRLLDKDPAATAEALFYFQDAARVILSRPDFDHVRSTLFLDVRKRLADFDAVEDAVERLIDEGIWGLRAAETNRAEKITYVHILLNAMAEIRPEVNKNERFRAAVEKVRDARLPLPTEVVDSAEVRTMTRLKPPSDVAQEILAQK